MTKKDIMDETKPSSQFKQMNLRYQLYIEARAMAEYALTNGLEVPEIAIKTIEDFTDNENNSLNDYEHIKTDLDIADLLFAHSVLVKIVDPAKPKTILLLDIEQKKMGFMKFLGPVSLIRQMMVMALICLFIFIILAMTKSVRAEGGNVMSHHGPELLLNLLFYLAAAGLGACFAGLYKANFYITSGTFDPTYHASYWIRFFLGLIAGLILAIMVSEDYFALNVNDEVDFLAPGIARPLLAILGGFSADLTYTVLSRLTETFQSLFMGSPENRLKQVKQEKQVELEHQKNQQYMSTASSLVNIQQKIAKGATPEELKDQINALIKDQLPGTEIPTNYKLADRDKVKETPKSPPAE